MMDLLNGKVRPIFLKYFRAAFGSAMISSIYGIVDMAMVGQYQGPDGTGALAVVAPIWNIIYSLGLLTGIGGSVLYSTEKGKNTGDERPNEFYTASLLLSAGLTVLCWLAVSLFDKQMLMLFGANEQLLFLAEDYLYPIKFVFPCFLLNQMLAAFLRNDNAPGLAAGAVLFGGIFNVFGDYFFVFVCDLGIRGAGIATAMGAVFSFLAMLTHFVSKENTLRLKRPPKILSKMAKIVIHGFSSFFIDVAMGILTMMFNRQIMRYSGTSALAVYGVIVNISTIVQCCAYSVGQASQPLMSMNYGAKQFERIKETLKYALYIIAFFSVAWTGAMMAFPNGFIRIFMNATEEIFQIAPGIIRTYAVSFILLPLNVFSSYYFQSIMRPKAAFVLSVLRGLVVSGGMIYILPFIGGADLLWWAMPITELIICIPTLYNMKLPIGTKYDRINH